MVALLISFFLLVQPFYSFSTELLQGDACALAGTTFSFPINAFAQSKNTSGLYVGAAQAGAKEYSIAGINYTKTKFKPIAVELINIDGSEEKVANPLYNQAIAQIAPLQLKSGDNDDALVVIKADEPNALYVQQLFEIPHMVICKDCKDAAGNSANGIVAMTTNSDGKVFAAVKGHDQLTFGAGDSGIAVFTLYLKTEKDEKKSENNDAQKNTKKSKALEEKEKKEQEPEQAKKMKWEFLQQDVVPGPITKEEEESKKSRAMLLAKNSTHIALHGPLSAMHITDMHWDNSLNVLYLAFDAQAGADAQDGVRSIATVQLTADNKIILSAIAADEVFNSADYNTIVGAQGAYTTACAHAVRSMFTTTMAHYIIVHGGVGANTKRTISALPVLNMKAENGTIAPEKISLHGSLAKVKKPRTKFRSVKSHLFLGRYFDEPAQKAEDVYHADSFAAQVGGGPLHADIATMMVRDDTVFALVRSEDESQAGIYYSQALFEHDGAIGGWTQWQKTQVAGMDCITGSYEFARGNFVLLKDSGSSGSSVVRTGWSLEHALTPAIAKHFTEKNKEISGLFEFQTEQGPLLAITGTRTMMLSEGDTQTITAYAEGAIADMGTVTAAALIEMHDQERLLVGGLHGLAYLGKQTTDIKTLCSSYDGMQFAKVGDYTCVRKLIADEQYLYVLTDTYLDRIDLRASDFANNVLAATRVYTADSEILTDALVSEKFALLATSTGLLRVGNECDIRSARNQTDVCWAPVILEGNKFPILSLFAITLSGNAKDLARLPIAQVYVLAGYVGKNTACLYRLAIQADEEITDDTVRMLQDWKNEKNQGAFIRFGEFRELFATDGTLYLNIRGKQNDQPALLLNGIGKYRHQLIEDKSITHATALMHSKVTGSWMLAGNFGLLINK